MNIRIFDAQETYSYKAKLNVHLQLIFDQYSCVEINDELVCSIVIEMQKTIVACGFAYSREMTQGSKFRAGIIGGIAVHPNFRGLGLSKVIMKHLDERLIAEGVNHSFLFAYEPKVYVSSGYNELKAQIHYYDIQHKKWERFVYRGGMIKSYTSLILNEYLPIEFNGRIY